MEVQDLVVNRGGREVLHGLRFSLVAGQITGLLGPSGSGKTTLLRALVGVQGGVSGTVRVLGVPAGSAAMRRRVGYVTQAPAVYSDLSVQENLTYFSAVLSAGAARVDTVLGQVGLTGHRRRLVQTLSGGERARVSLASALLSSPELLVLDEPTVGLDPEARIEVWQVIQHLADSGTTVFLTTQYLDEAERLADRIAILHEGTIIVSGTLEDLRKLLPPARVEYVERQPSLEEIFLAIVGSDKKEQR